MQKFKVSITDLDRHINAYELSKEFGNIYGNKLNMILNRQIPTKCISTDVPTYIGNGFALIKRSNYTHFLLSDIYKVSLERLESLDGKVNKQMWVDLQNFVKKDMLETYTMLRRCYERKQA